MKEASRFRYVWILALALAARSAPSIAAPYDARVRGGAILTPAPTEAPRIHGPEVYGARPGRPFMYRIPCQGERPLRFEAKGLPAGLKLDREKGLVSGTVPARKGDYPVTFTAANAHGRGLRGFTLVVGDKLALTPPMGWNHWYTHYHFVTDRIIRSAADTMVSSGMADAGYQYVSIDDCWMRIAEEFVAESMDQRRKTASKGLDIEAKIGPVRDAEGRILPARDFPDMKALTDHIHGYGLKAGIYSSPGPRTCQRFEGSYQHEAMDARTYAEWGFDLLKYDWCAYGSIFGALPEGQQDLEARKKPYRLMGRLLSGQDRDIVMNLCQYGVGEVWTWGAEVGGQSWRVGGDLGHTLTEGGVYRIAEKNIHIGSCNRPGSWNDPDYLILGNWTSPFDKAGPFIPITLTANEQYSYFSLWCLMACPLFYSGDMASLDDFTRSLICNTELIAVNQDRLGQCAESIRMDKEAWVLKKNLADGGVVVGFFDTSNQGDRQIQASWEELGLSGTWRARDLWRQKDIGPCADAFSVKVGPRGCAVIRLDRQASP